MKKICACLSSFAVLVSGGNAIAQQATDSITNNANPLQGTTSINSPNDFFTPTNSNFLQYNNGTNLACNRTLCVSMQHQITPTGNTSTIGVTFSLGGSPDDTRAEAEKAKVEIDSIRASREFKLKLMENIATAIEAKQCLRARIFSQELAKMSGYNSHWDYLKDIDAQICMR